MLGKFAAAALVATSLMVATPVAAATMYDITLRGHLISGGGAGAGALSVGDTVTFRMVVPLDYTVAWGASGQTVAGSRYSEIGGFGSCSCGAPVWSGARYTLTLGPYAFYDIDPFDWYGQSKDAFDENTGEITVNYHRFLGGPAVAFKDGKVTGIWSASELFSEGVGPTNALMVAGGRALPPTGYEAEIPNFGVDEHVFGPIVPERYFAVNEGGPLSPYSLEYDNRAFLGEWDFANSVVLITGVPEPGSWALMILGFGLAGARLRRRLSLAPI